MSAFEGAKADYNNLKEKNENNEIIAENEEENKVTKGKKKVKSKTPIVIVKKKVSETPKKVSEDNKVVPKKVDEDNKVIEKTNVEMPKKKQDESRIIRSIKSIKGIRPLEVSKICDITTRNYLWESLITENAVKIYEKIRSKRVDKLSPYLSVDDLMKLLTNILNFLKSEEYEPFYSQMKLFYPDSHLLFKKYLIDLFNSDLSQTISRPPRKPLLMLVTPLISNIFNFMSVICPTFNINTLFFSDSINYSDTTFSIYNNTLGLSDILVPLRYIVLKQLKFISVTQLLIVLNSENLQYLNSDGNYFYSSLTSSNSQFFRKPDAPAPSLYIFVCKYFFPLINSVFKLQSMLPTPLSTTFISSSSCNVLSSTLPFLLETAECLSFAFYECVRRYCCYLRLGCDDVWNSYVGYSHEDDDVAAWKTNTKCFFFFLLCFIV
jgi:hypothetical protein